MKSDAARKKNETFFSVKVFLKKSLEILWKSLDGGDLWPAEILNQDGASRNPNKQTKAQQKDRKEEGGGVGE